MSQQAVQSKSKTEPRGVLRAVVTRADGRIENYGIVSHWNPIVHWLMQRKVEFYNWRHLRREERKKKWQRT